MIDGPASYPRSRMTNSKSPLMALKNLSRAVDWGFKIRLKKHFVIIASSLPTTSRMICAKMFMWMKLLPKQIRLWPFYEGIGEGISVTVRSNPKNEHKKTPVKPTFELSATVWDPYIAKTTQQANWCASLYAVQTEYPKWVCLLRMRQASERTNRQESGVHSAFINIKAKWTPDSCLLVTDLSSRVVMWLLQNLCSQQMLRARANGETFVSATMCPQQCVLVSQYL